MSANIGNNYKVIEKHEKKNGYEIVLRLIENSYPVYDMIFPVTKKELSHINIGDIIELAGWIRGNENVDE